jgi:hypothetical protein
MGQESENLSREDRIRQLLLTIGGLEETLRLSISKGDRGFQRMLDAQKMKYYEQLRRVMYGLPEERRVGPEA